MATTVAIECAVPIRVPALELDVRICAPFEQDLDHVGPRRRIGARNVSVSGRRQAAEIRGDVDRCAPAEIELVDVRAGFDHEHREVEMQILERQD